MLGRFKKKTSSQSRQIRGQIERFGNKGSAGAFSYHASRRIPDSNAQTGRSKSQSRPVRRLPWVGLVATASIVLLFLGFLLPLNANSKIVVVKNNDNLVMVRDEQEYKKAADQLLGQSIISRNKITFDHQAFSKAMLDRFPELLAADVGLPVVGQTPTIRLVASPSVLRMRLGNGDQTILLDKRGRVLMPISAVIGRKDELERLPLVIDDTASAPAEMGKNVMSTQSVQFIKSFTEQLAAKNISVNLVKMTGQASEVRFEPTGQRYFVKASLMTDPRVAAGEYMAVKQKLSADKKEPTEYIDVRVEERVFVK